MQLPETIHEPGRGPRRRHKQLSLLLVGSEEVFKAGVTQRMLPGNHFRIIARSSSLLEAEACLDSNAIDVVLLSPEYQGEELSLFTFDVRRRGFAGLILLAADVPGKRRDSGGEGHNSIQVGDFFLHESSQRAWIRGVEVEFSPMEFGLLHFLCIHPEELLSHDMLLKMLWGKAATSRHSLRVLIRALRLRVETTAQPRYIVTERKAGYRFIPSPDASPQIAHPVSPTGAHKEKAV